jgi:DNA-directed RNA polymerase subunit beta'
MAKKNQDHDEEMEFEVPSTSDAYEKTDEELDAEFEAITASGSGGLTWRAIPLGSEKEGADIDLNALNVVARVSIASPETILGWSSRHNRASDRTPGRSFLGSSLETDASSFGEVKKPETINYRTFKPERDGLFCERIFGPTKDWECACGKYKRIKYKGIICDRCGVEVIESKVRRTRMGHIKLAAPVCHIWFYKGTTSRIATLLDISSKELQKVVYYQNYIVIDPGDSPLKPMQILTDEDARKYQAAHKGQIKIGIGAEAIQLLLEKLGDRLEEEFTKLDAELRKVNSVQKRTKIIKRMKIIEAFKSSPNRPEWMIMTVLPVIPPELRPLVHLDGGRFATSDLNDLYRRVINRNNRLKKLMELKAPEVILRNEKRMLQESVDALFDNSRRTRPTKGHTNRPLKSLSDMLKGKQGRFRQNLLGKRVDYSGRSVIVVGPELRFNECGLPKLMALELFEPFIIRELKARGYTNTIRTAKTLIQKQAPEVFDVLDDIIKDHPVLLNRAPTLHRLGVQAFMPRLIEGKAIQLHPLSTTAFNADFDGDQMAVHVPLSTEARLEAKMMILAENNILSPANGKPISVPSQDMVLGMFYLTKDVPNDERYGGKAPAVDADYFKDTRTPRFATREDVELALAHKLIKLHEPIIIRETTVAEDGTRNVQKILTTPGRVLVANALIDKDPHTGEKKVVIDFFDRNEGSFANNVLTKGALGQIVDLAHRRVGPAPCARTLDRIKDLGYRYAKLGGISIAVRDMLIPEAKDTILEEAKAKVDTVVEHYDQGLITYGERYQQVIHEWSLAGEKLASTMMDRLKGDQRGLNPIYIMAFSGARGNESQIRQLCGMRGLMQKPTKKITGDVGEIIERPITSNFREGLTVLEYFISTHGARKGLADTALKTSDAGYLTRRLCDVAQDLIITEEDCGAYEGPHLGFTEQPYIVVEPIVEVTRTGEREVSGLAERIDGRVAFRDVVDAEGTVIVRANELIDRETARRIDQADLRDIQGNPRRSVAIRSVLTCRTKRGICARCYGRNLATGRLVEIGESIGIIAAQSIGEPGTQLTLRTFHIGGAASIDVEGWYQATHDGVLEAEGIELIRTESSSNKNQPEVVGIVRSRGGRMVVKDSGKIVQTLPDIPYGARLKVEPGATVKRGQRIVEWDPHFSPIIAEHDGNLLAVDLDEKTMSEQSDSGSDVTQRVINEHKEDRHPAFILLGEPKVYDLEVMRKKVSIDDEEAFRTRLLYSAADIKKKTTTKVRCGQHISLENLRDVHDALKSVKGSELAVIVYDLTDLLGAQAPGNHAHIYYALGNSTNFEQLSSDGIEKLIASATVGKAVRVKACRALARYSLSAGVTLSQDMFNEEGEFRRNLKVKAGLQLARIPKTKAKARDITGGLPRIDELFEARKPKEVAFISSIDGTVHLRGSVRGQLKLQIESDQGLYWRHRVARNNGIDPHSDELREMHAEIVIDSDTKVERRIVSFPNVVHLDGSRGVTIEFTRDATVPKGEGADLFPATAKYAVDPFEGRVIAEYSIPSHRQLLVRDGEVVRRGDALTEGTPSPHDVLAVEGEKSVMEFLLNQVQEVYRLQKVTINDKHIECIVRQMLRKIVVEDPGNTTFLNGQPVDRGEFDAENQRVRELGGTPAKGRPKLLGLTKASLETDSFISAASFQETTRVLTEAALRGRFDYLRGLKENVIMGLLIPAGTGMPVYRNIEVLTHDEAERRLEGGHGYGDGGSELEAEEDGGAIALLEDPAESDHLSGIEADDE